jgi:[ribosomal protein S5]-alanine N-acetyltransferase
VIFPETFESERLTLRRPLQEDASYIFERYASDPEVTKYINWKTHSSIVETKEFLERVAEKWDGLGERNYVIESRNGASGPIGMIAMRHVEESEIQFGYVLAREYWKQGLMSEALIMLVSWALGKEQISRVSALCDVENLASARIMEKAGLTKERRLYKSDICPNISALPRDHFLYSRLK